MILWSSLSTFALAILVTDLGYRGRGGGGGGEVVVSSLGLLPESHA